MKNKFFKQLLELSEEFEQEHTNEAEQTPLRFAAWLTHRTTAPPAESPEFSGKFESPELQHLRYIPAFLAQQITTLDRYVKYYIKKALAYTAHSELRSEGENESLISFDDFIFLVILIEEGTMTKTALIQRNNNGKATGMLVIRRLQEKGFVEQSDDETDKRSQRITITEQGRAVLTNVLPAINNVITLLTGDLSRQEQLQFLYLLLRLNKFHTPIFLQDKGHATLESIMKQF
jgi:MarR family transcriptional regulator, lower aerobic nicotinate degradation pathway regulator